MEEYGIPARYATVLARTRDSAFEAGDVSLGALGESLDDPPRVAPGGDDGSAAEQPSEPARRRAALGL